jgi:hypothetical protein
MTFASPEPTTGPEEMSTFSAPVSGGGSEGENVSSPAPKVTRKRAPRKQATKKVTPKEG